MAIFRKHKTINYTSIDNNIFKDKRLSYKATGLLCMMLSLPDEWDFSVSGLEQMKTENKSAITSALKELEENGYLIRTQNRDKKGVFTGTIYNIYEQPITEKPMTEKPMTENQPQLNNIYINNLNNKKENTKRKIFKKPTIDEIQQYCDERNNGINAEAFYDFYESKDWMIGKNKMKDYKACIRTWEQRNKVAKIETKEQLPDWWDKDFKKETPDNDEMKELIKKYE